MSTATKAKPKIKIHPLEDRVVILPADEAETMAQFSTALSQTRSISTTRVPTDRRSFSSTALPFPSMAPLPRLAMNPSHSRRVMWCRSFVPPSQRVHSRTFRASASRCPADFLGLSWRT